ncbi:LodA/GoxA family CTQ-dependent oxidase [Nisaea acidiphila]|uniref:LodA/GoxA family CTQ-dependent oxidase n=1 Tax=Nisaea acidiphila TaxID=1862145 RepID=A0A9J7AV40_9PROT|nr:LodA/GoxA family CTQ-dependent oxidase [Nisaea acidiphila]UUX50982.1 LodA/GoxA family CTQ-dependent oxidase [Nisaea acidiphila]
MADKKIEAENNRRKSANDVACWDCSQNATERLEEMFVNLIQRERIAKGQTPARRTVFLKQHGVAYGFFKPLPKLPAEWKIGTFSHGELPCWVRFSSDTQPTSPDLHSTLGIGIKLFDVPGPKLLGVSDTADFIMQNHDVFFVDNATEFCEFTTAGVVDGNYPRYLRDHPKTAHILNEMEKAEASCLTANYWAILPFGFGTDGNGEQRYVKYRLEPVGQEVGEPFDENDYLAVDLASRLRRDQAVFKFMIQPRGKPKDDPLDEATVRWSGDWIHIADLVLPKQDIERRGQSSYGENLAFNIWRTPPEQEPQGSIAAARKVVYQGSADQRRLANGVTLTEPETPAPAEAPGPVPDDCIVTAAIYPPIGVCRVGNSPNEFYIGPEVPDPAPLKPGDYRDSKGRLKREAARFRIYGLNALGEPVRELLPDGDTEIKWKVTLENQKSAWYQFQLALDIPEAADADPSLLRNSTVSDRSALRITPGERRISGKNRSGKRYHFADGRFMGERVYLGELRTDKEGRLIVLGGHGKSSSYDGGRAVTFANNEGWHDDTSDGPVIAKVSYKGVPLKVAPAWVVCAPPNYGPQQKSVRTMWDLMRDVAVEAGTLPHPKRPSFQRDIRPIFERMSALQWVNQGFAGGFGFGSPFDFSSRAWLERLGDPSPANLEMRRVLKNNFRHFDTDGNSPVPWPWLYGDAMNVPPADTPRQNAELSKLQLWALEQWAIGNFDADYDPDEVPPCSIDDVPVADQPDILTRAAMDFCLADAFHPGCEMTWPMRHSGMYMAPFRLKHRKRDNPEVSYGAELTPDTLSLPDGPLDGGQSPGSITRWMAVPWQTDTSSCRAGYVPSYDPYLPTFWPARVPNQVMGEEAYKIVMNESLPRSERLQAFANRANWLEPLGLEKGYTHQINHMIHHFDQMGVVEVRSGLPDDPDFPAVMQVSDQPQPEVWKRANVETEAEDWRAEERLGARITASRPDAEAGPDGVSAPTDLSSIEKVNRFPHGLLRSRSR